MMEYEDAVDQSTLEMLQELLGEDFQDLVETFLRDAPQRLTELQRAVEVGTPEVLERPAHTLKGAAANLGAEGLAGLCARLVQACRNGEVKDPQAQVDAIEGELERVSAALRRCLEG